MSEIVHFDVADLIVEDHVSPSVLLEKHEPRASE